MTTAYLQSLLPFWELQNEQAGSYLLASHTGNLQDPEVSLFLPPAVQPAPEWKPITQRIQIPADT